ncbi:uncharacterized protein LOC142924606 [Petromyzon marinus]|uniref:uncharacterized protein LOC142924606 n=1 Tax=Petromyzon marinus TaxID=7757 RepID=UPI003F6FC85A
MAAHQINAQRRQVARVLRQMKENVEATELALAFPLEQAEPGERSGGLPSLLDKQPVFAFLPLRSYGFRFIIQGDFEVSSSREDVDRDSAWNQWLRSEIPGLFLLALHTFTVIGKAQKGEREAMDRGLARIECDIKQEVEGRPHKIKKYLLESFPLPGTSADLRRQFTIQPAAEMVLQVFQNAEDIFVNKLKKCVQDFLGQVKGDTLARKLFQLALCCGSLETPRDLVVKEKPAAFLGNISTPDTRPPLLPWSKETNFHIH